MGKIETPRDFARQPWRWVPLNAVLATYPGCDDCLRAWVTSGDVATTTFGACDLVDEAAIQAMLKPLDIAEARKRTKHWNRSTLTTTHSTVNQTEAATHSAVSPRTIRKAILSGHLTATRRGVGKLAEYVITLDDLRLWQSRTRPNTHDLYQQGMKAVHRTKTDVPQQRIKNRRDVNS